MFGTVLKMIGAICLLSMFASFCPQVVGFIIVFLIGYGLYNLCK